MTVYTVATLLERALTHQENKAHHGEEKSLDGVMLHATLQQKSPRGGIGKVYHEPRIAAMLDKDGKIRQLETLYALANEFAPDHAQQKKFKPHAYATLLALICVVGHAERQSVAIQKLKQLYALSLGYVDHRDKSQGTLAKDKHAVKIRNLLAGFNEPQPIVQQTTSTPTQVNVLQTKIELAILSSQTPLVSPAEDEKKFVLPLSSVTMPTTATQPIAKVIKKPAVLTYKELIQNMPQRPTYDKFDQEAYFLRKLKELDEDNLEALLKYLRSIQQGQNPSANDKHGFEEIRRERFYGCFGSGNTSTWVRVVSATKQELISRFTQCGSFTLVMGERTYARYYHLFAFRTSRWLKRTLGSIFLNTGSQIEFLNSVLVRKEKDYPVLAEKNISIGSLKRYRKS